MNRQLKRFTLLSLSIIISMSLIGCSSKVKEIEPRGKAYFSYFDTVSYIYSYAGDSDERFDELTSLGADELDKYHKYFDIYYEYENVNNCKTINLNAGISPVEVDEELITFLKYCKDIYIATNGKLNVMIGALTSLWHDARVEAENGKASIPSEESLLEASKHIDINSLIIDEENKTVYINDPLAKLDVGAIGKGYAVERCAEVLKENNADHYVLNCGGNIRCIGTKIDGSGWSTGIKNPFNTEEFILKVNIKDTSIVTSGTYERYYVYEGNKYHHIIDPETLYPADYYESISIITKDSGLADGLSTALFLSSIEEGKEIIKKFDDVEVIWVLKDGSIELTEHVNDIIISE